MERAAAVAERYDREAEAYARYWAPILHPLARRLLDAMPLADARTVIDIGAGTGTLIPDIGRAAPAAVIVGLDRSHGMLRVGMEICKMQNAKCKSSIELAQMDAGRLALRNAAFDAAVMAFMLFHLASPPDGLGEAARILKPTGVLGVVTWGLPPDCAADLVWREELDNFGAPPDPAGPDAKEQMDTPEKLAALLTNAGFEPRCWTEESEHESSAGIILARRFYPGGQQVRHFLMQEEVKPDFERRVRERFAELPTEAFRYQLKVVYGIGGRR